MSVDLIEKGLDVIREPKVGWIYSVVILGTFAILAFKEVHPALAFGISLFCVSSVWIVIRYFKSKKRLKALNDAIGRIDQALSSLPNNPSKLNKLNELTRIKNELQRRRAKIDPDHIGH